MSDKITEITEINIEALFQALAEAVATSSATDAKQALEESFGAFHALNQSLNTVLQQRVSKLQKDAGIPQPKSQEELMVLLQNPEFVRNLQALQAKTVEIEKAFQNEVNALELTDLSILPASLLGLKDRLHEALKEDKLAPSDVITFFEIVAGLYAYYVAKGFVPKFESRVVFTGFEGDQAQDNEGGDIVFEITEDVPDGLADRIIAAIHAEDDQPNR